MKTIAAAFFFVWIALSAGWSGRRMGNSPLVQPQVANPGLVEPAILVRKHQETNSGLFLWEVTGPSNNTCWLLGTIHAASENLYPLNERIENAFRQSPVLAVEARVDKIFGIFKTMGSIFRDGYYPLSESLPSHIRGSLLGRVRKIFEEAGYRRSDIERMRPWLLFFLLENIPVEGSANFRSDLGIDMHFLGLARGVKEIRELESVEYQIGLFSAMPETAQEALLEQSLNGRTNGDNGMQHLEELWKNGDTAGLDRLMNQSAKEDPRLTKFYRRLIHDRNVHMADRVSEWLDAGDSVFTAAGSAHMTGESGVPALLARMGYRVIRH